MVGCGEGWYRLQGCLERGAAEGVCVDVSVDRPRPGDDQGGDNEAEGDDAREEEGVAKLGAPNQRSVYVHFSASLPAWRCFLHPYKRWTRYFSHLIKRP